MNKRLQAVRKASGLTQTEFANRIGLTKNYISLLETGVRIPSDRTILDVCRVYGCSEHWLRTGEGEMLVPKTEEEELAALFNSVLSEDALPFKQKLIAAIAKLPDEAVKEIESFARDLVSHHED